MTVARFFSWVFLCASAVAFSQGMALSGFGASYRSEWHAWSAFVMFLSLFAICDQMAKARKGGA